MFCSCLAPSPGVDCRPANGSLSAGNIRRIFDGIFEMPCAEWYTSVDSLTQQAPESTVGQPMAVRRQGIYVEYSME
eukprot:1196127-Prorocentrum_minimum.AAC.2